MDTTYFGCSFGVMVFLDNKTGVILDYKIVPYETNKYYHQGIKEIQSKGIHVHSIICDGRRAYWVVLALSLLRCAIFIKYKSSHAI